MRAELLALLEDGAHTAAELADWLKGDRLQVIHELKAMRTEGLVWRHDSKDGATWSLTGVLAPTTQPAKELRQPHERPEHVTLSPEQQSSWWVGLSRDELSKAAAERSAQMRQSKAGRLVLERMLQRARSIPNSD